MLFATIIAATACSDSTGLPAYEEPPAPADPTCPPATHCLLVTGLAGPGYGGIGRAVLVDADRRAVLGHVGPALDFAGSSTLLDDGETVLLPGSWGGPGVLAFDVRTATVLWWQPVPPAHGTLPAYAPPQVALQADDDRILVDDGQVGIAQIRRSTDSTEFFAPQVSYPGRLFRTRSGRGVPAGTVISRGTQDPVAPYKVYLYSPSLTLVDSIMPPAGLSVSDIALSPDDTLLYVLAPPRLFAVNLVTMSTVYDVQTPSRGALWTSVDGAELFQTESESRRYPASGVMLEFARDLSSSTEIPLVHPDSPDPVPSAWVATSYVGTAYVLTGGLTTVGFGEGTAVIRVVDLRAGVVADVIPIGEYGLHYGLQLLGP